MFVPAMAGVSHGFWKGSARELEARRLTDFGGGQRRRARRSGVSLARLLIGSLLCARVTGARPVKGTASRRASLAHDRPLAPVLGRLQESGVGCERYSRDIGSRRMDKVHNAGNVHPNYERAFNSGDIDATVACYEVNGSFVARSGRVVRGTEELREVYRITFANKPTIKIEIGRIIPAGDDLALIIGPWTSTAKTTQGETKVWSGTYADIVRKQPDGTWKLVLDNPNGVETMSKKPT
jgi:uncharacterized protein (TIGR02246 family)